MSLQDSWQQRRQQRQQAIAQRQQAVCDALLTTRQKRLQVATQLRDDLALYRATIAHHDIARRESFQPFQASLQQFHASLETDVQALLTHATDHRRVQAEQLAQTLQQFTQELRQQTAQSLATATAERAARAETLEAELTAFVDALKSDVQSYLWEMQTIRQQRADQLAEALAQARAKRVAETQALFRQFAPFRSELRRFCVDLRQSVWSDASASNPTLDSVPLPASKNPKTVAVEPSVTPGSKQPISPSPVPQAEAIAALLTKPVKLSSKDGSAYEKEVYNYIHEVQGARLTQIEAALGINRFQAVDALRSLIQKGLVTQRDRIYLIQDNHTTTRG